MHHGNKADILKLICPDDVRYENAPVTPTALVIDASVLVRQRRPIGCSKIGDYMIKFFGQKYLSCLTIMIELLR